MSMSIFSVTKGGYALSKQLNKHYPQAELYTMKKIGAPPDHLMEGTFKACVAEAFAKDMVLVFVMATGIVVRTLAGLLQHKTIDPAVIVIDEKGNHVISLLSGHIGGGNALAHEIAKKIGGQPVITTSSDVQDKIAVDVLAVNNGLVIDSMEDAKHMASAIVNDENLIMVTDAKVSIELDSKWRLMTVEAYEDAPGKSSDHVLLISNKRGRCHPKLKLIPRNIVLGIGCRRNTSSDRIIQAIKVALANYDLDIRSVRKLATVDVKADEVGLIEAAGVLGLPLEIVGRDRIKTIQNDFEGSDFVEKTIGVRAVCEPVAVIASDKTGKFIMNKTAFEGITIAIWEEEYEIR